METTLIVALVAAGSALLGGLLSAFATRRVEFMRLRAGLTEKANERKLATLEKFLLAVNAWLDWLVYIEDQGWSGEVGKELNLRVKKRDDAYRRLMLLASEPLHQWLLETYNPQEYELKKTYVRQVRFGGTVDDQAKAARQDFSRLLREDLIEQFRPEIAILRDPLLKTQRSRLGQGN